MPPTKASAQSNIQEHPRTTLNSTPSLSIEVHGKRQKDEIESLKKSIITRLFDEGYCLSNQQTDLRIMVSLNSDRSQVTIRSDSNERTFLVHGRGALTSLELVHRLESELHQHWNISNPRSNCRADAIFIRPGPSNNLDLFYQWVYALSQSEGPIARAQVPKKQQLCFSADHAGIVLETGEFCQTQLYFAKASSNKAPIIPSNSIPPQITKSEIDQIVGASLMHHASTPKAPSIAKMKSSHNTPSKPRTNPTTRRESPQPIVPLTKETLTRSIQTPSRSIQTPSRETQFHTFAGAGVANRRGGTDASVHLQGGVLLRSKLLFSTGLSITSAFLKERVIATDTDLGGVFGYLWTFSNRYGLRGSVSGGFRQHSYYSSLHRHRFGKATWFAGTSIFFWKEFRKSFNVELGVQQRFSGHAWTHEVGTRSLGQRGRYQASLIFGFSWQGV